MFLYYFHKWLKVIRIFMILLVFVSILIPFEVEVG